MSMAFCVTCPSRRGLQAQLDAKGTEIALLNERIARMEAEVNDVRRMYHADGPETSKDAAFSLDRESVDQRVLRAVRDAGDIGLTVQECAAQFSTHPSNVSGSFTRGKRNGLIVLLGRRPNPETGHNCEFFRIAPGITV